MLKLNSVGDKIQGESSSSRNSFGISQCDRFEIKNEGKDFYAKKITSNLNRKESTSDKTKNNGVKGRLNSKSINSSEVTFNNEKKPARTNIYSEESNHPKESNFWNGLMMNSESTKNFQNKFEHVSSSETKNNKNEFPVPNKIDFTNKIFTKSERAERFNPNNNSDNNSSIKNSNNPISENDVEMEFLLNLTNLNNNESNVSYNFNKNFSEEGKINEFEYDAVRTNHNRNVQNFCSNGIQLNNVKNLKRNFDCKSSMQDDAKNERIQQAKPINKKPKTPRISRRKITENWEKMDIQVDNSRNNVTNNNLSSVSNKPSNNSNNIHNKSKINSSANYIKMFNNPEIQLDDNKISSLKFHLQNRNKFDNQGNTLRSQMQSKAINSQENSKETPLINVHAQDNNLLSCVKEMNNISTHNFGNLSSNNSNRKTGNLNSLNSLINSIGNLNNNPANSNSMNMTNSKLFNKLKNNDGLNSCGSMGNLNLFNNSVENSSSLVDSINNKKEHICNQQGNSKEKSNTFNNTQNNSQSCSNQNSNFQRGNQEKDVQGFLVDKVSEILSGNTLNDKISPLKMITSCDNDNPAKSFAENYVLLQEMIKYTIESFCKYLKNNNYHIVKNEESNRASSNSSETGLNKINSNSNLSMNMKDSEVNSGKSCTDNKQENYFLNFESESRSNFDSVNLLNKKRNKSPKEVKAMTEAELERINNKSQDTLILPVKNAKYKFGSNLPILNENKSLSSQIPNSELICSHNDKKHYAKNMCKSCYNTKGKLKKAWLCPHIFQAHYARGKCRNCYLNFYNKEHNKKNLKPNEFLEKIECSQNIFGNNFNEDDGNNFNDDYGNNQEYKSVNMGNIQSEKLFNCNYDVNKSKL